MFNRRLFTTRFNQATNTTGESITVIINNITEEGKRLSRKQKTIAYNYNLDAMDNHLEAIYEVTDEVPILSKFKNLKRGYQFVEVSVEESENINLYL